MLLESACNAHHLDSGLIVQIINLKKKTRLRGYKSFFWFVSKLRRNLLWYTNVWTSYILHRFVPITAKLLSSQGCFTSWGLKLQQFHIFILILFWFTYIVNRKCIVNVDVKWTKGWYIIMVAYHTKQMISLSQQLNRRRTILKKNTIQNLLPH